MIYKVCWCVVILFSAVNALYTFSSFPNYNDYYSKIDINQLNTSAPELIKLADKLETYGRNYLSRDLHDMKPHLEFLVNFWVPVETQSFINAVESFIEKNLSSEFKHVRTNLIHYMNSDTARLDIYNIYRESQRFMQSDLTKHVQRYHVVLTYYYDTFVSNDLKVVINEILTYSEKHATYELKSIESYLKNTF